MPRRGEQTLRDKVCHGAIFAALPRADVAPMLRRVTCHPSEGIEKRGETS